MKLYSKILCLSLLCGSVCTIVSMQQYDDQVLQDSIGHALAVVEHSCLMDVRVPRVDLSLHLSDGCINVISSQDAQQRPHIINSEAIEFSRLLMLMSEVCDEQHDTIYSVFSHITYVHTAAIIDDFQ